MIDLEPLPVAERREVALSIAPAGFIYPPKLLAMLDGELPDIFPHGWLYIWKTVPERFAAALEELYPERSLVPFGKVDREDDIFCFDGNDHSGDPPVQVIHYAASPGWEFRGEWRNFEDWWLDTLATREAWLAQEHGA